MNFLCIVGFNVFRNCKYSWWRNTDTAGIRSGFITVCCVYQCLSGTVVVDCSHIYNRMIGEFIWIKLIGSRNLISPGRITVGWKRIITDCTAVNLIAGFIVYDVVNVSIVFHIRLGGCIDWVDKCVSTGRNYRRLIVGNFPLNDFVAIFCCGANWSIAFVCRFERNIIIWIILMRIAIFGFGNYFVIRLTLIDHTILIAVLWKIYISCISDGDDFSILHGRKGVVKACWCITSGWRAAVPGKCRRSADCQCIPGDCICYAYILAVSYGWYGYRIFHFPCVRIEWAAFCYICLTGNFIIEYNSFYHCVGKFDGLSFFIELCFKFIAETCLCGVCQSWKIFIGLIKSDR